MIIKFKLEDYYDVCDEYEAVLEQADFESVTVGEDCLVVRLRRIVIPELHASFREADWYALNPDCDDPDDDDAWEIQDSVIVQYEESETDLAKFISYATCDIMEYIEELCDDETINVSDPSQLECLVDTEEFLEEGRLQDILGT